MFLMDYIDFTLMEGKYKLENIINGFDINRY